MPLAVQVIETSKTAFYAVGAAFIAYALIVSVAGIFQPEFPGGAIRGRLLMVVGMLLAAGTLTTAIATA